MAALFLDSSAIVKRYVSEAGSSWVMGLCDAAAGNAVHAVRIAAVEVAAAITRRSRQAGLLPQMHSALATARADFQSIFRIVEVSPDLLGRAVDLAIKHTLRGYDAVQLAGALAVNAEYAAEGASLTLVSADVELNAAAAAEGLTVDDPNGHL